MTDSPLFNQQQMLNEVRAADTNRDGRVSTEEVLALADKARNGTATPAQFGAAIALSQSNDYRAGFGNPMPSIRMDRALDEARDTFRRLNQNGDRGISQSELDYSQRGLLNHFQSYENFMKKNADKYR